MSTSRSPLEPASTVPPSREAMCLDFAAEIADYERLARVARWDGPRYRMTYRVLGDGPTLIVVQGLASTHHGYAPFLNRLASRFRTVIYDYPGEHPGDGADLRRITHDSLVDDLLGLGDHLDARGSSLFAASFGSTVVLSALRRDPALAGRVAIQGGFVRRPLNLPERVALRVGRRMPGTLARLPLRGPVLAWHNKRTFPAEVVASRWPIFVTENGRTPIAGMAHRLDMLAHIDLRPALPEIPVETLLLHGDADGIVSRGHFDELAAGLPRCRPRLLPGVGHQPHFTHPEWLADLVGEFLVGEGCRFSP